jgi:hypothetical protein
MTRAGNRGTPARPASVGADPVRILRGWWSAAGESLARAAAPRGVSGDRLRIGTRGDLYAREIRAHEQVLLARLRRFPGLEGIRGLEVDVEAPETDRAGHAPDPPVPAPSAPPPEILAAAAGIPDPVLAARWARAVGKLISRAGSRGRGGGSPPGED